MAGSGREPSARQPAARAVREEAAAEEETPRSPGRPRKLPEEELKERVLVAATAVFAEEGYDDATSDRIADLSGIPRPTIYRMFGSKQGVFVAAVERALERIIEHQTRSLSNTTHLLGRSVTNVNVAAFLDLVTREPELIRMLQLADTSGGGTKAKAAASRRRVETAVAAYVRATWIGRRPLTEKEAVLGARLTVAVVEAGAIHWMENGGFEIEDLVEYLSNYIRTGFTFLREREPEP